MELKDYRNAEAFLKDLPELALPFRDKLLGKDEAFCFHLDGSPARYINIRAGRVTVEDHPDWPPVATLEAREQVLMDLLAGRISPMKALLFGGVRIRGSKGELLRLLNALS